MCLICGNDGGRRNVVDKYLSLIQEARNLGMKLAEPWQIATGNAHQKCAEKLIELVKIQRKKAKAT